MATVNVKTTDVDLTPEIEAYLDQKLSDIEKLLVYESDDEVTCDIELAHVRDQRTDAWRAEMNLAVRGEMYRAEARGESVQAALDEVKDEMMKRVRRSKRKRFHLLRRGGAKLKEFIRFGRRDT